MSSVILKKPLPYLALMVAYLIWGGNYVVAKLTLTEIPVFSLAFLRFAIALILLFPFLLAEKNKEKIKLEHLPRLLLTGLLMISFNIVFFYEALQRTTAINVSALELIIPILSVLGGWWFLKEKIYFVNLMGIFLGILGAAIIIGLPLLFVDGLSSGVLIGNLLSILSCISFVAGAILSKKLLKKYSALFMTCITFSVGVVTFLVPAMLDYVNNPAWVSKVSILGILGLLYIVILSSISAFFLFQWALAKVDLPKATLFQYFPAIAATFAVPILGERISFSFIIGTILVVLGVYWGTLGKWEHHHLHHRHHKG